MEPMTDTAYVDFPAQAGKQDKLFALGQNLYNMQNYSISGMT